MKTILNKAGIGWLLLAAALTLAAGGKPSADKNPPTHHSN